MKVNSLALLFVSITLVSSLTECADTNQKNSELPSYSSEYELEIYDTLFFPIQARVLRIYDYNPNDGKFILMSKVDKTTVYITDTVGNVLNELDFTGGSEQEVGNSVFNIAFYRGNGLLVNGQRGFNAYDSSGAFIKNHNNKTALRAYGGNMQYKSFVLNDTTIVLSLKNSVTDRMMRSFEEEFFENYHGATVMDLNSIDFDFVFPIEEQSIYNQNKQHYGDILSLFDFDSNKFYSLHNPDQRLYIYSRNFKLIESIPLDFKYFKTPYSYKFGASVNYEDGYDIVNSLYRELEAYDGNVCITYRSGIPIEQFEQLKSSDQLPGLFQQYMKYYLTIFEKGKLKAKEVMLPFPSVGLAHYENNNSILLYTNSAVTETEEYTVFYKARLIQK